MSQVIKLGKGDYLVTIHAYKVEEDIQNAMFKKITIPVVGDKQSAESYRTKILPLKAPYHTFQISGQIREQVITALHPTQIQTATTAKNVLIKYILYSKGLIQLYYRGISDMSYGYTGSNQYITCDFEKVKFIDSAERLERFKSSADSSVITSYGEPVAYDIELLLTRGVS